MKLSRIYNELVNFEWKGVKRPGQLRANADVVLNYFGDDTDIRTIDYKKVVEFVGYLKGKGVTGSTVNRKLSALSKMFTVAQRHDRRITRPEIPRQPENKPRKRVLTDDEATALINYPWKCDSHRWLVTLLIDTGVRPGEITDGEWSVQDDTLTLLDTKNGDDRFITLTPEALDAALKIKAGKRIHYSRFSKAFRQAVKDLKLPKGVMPYTIRHSALTKLAENTDNVILIQKWAGHKNLQTTQRYIKATKKGMDKLADVLRRR